MVRSAMRTAEQSWALRISGRLTPGATARLLNLIATDNDANDASDSSETVLGLIKASPGNVSLESMMIEIGKLQAARAIGHHLGDLFVSWTLADPPLELDVVALVTDADEKVLSDVRTTPTSSSSAVFDAFRFPADRFCPFRAQTTSHCRKAE